MVVCICRCTVLRIYGVYLTTAVSHVIEKIGYAQADHQVYEVFYMTSFLK